MSWFVRSLLCLALVGGFAVPAGARKQADRRLLAKAYPVDVLRTVLLPRDSWKPYPTAANPDGLARVPAEVRQAYVREGERLVAGEWEPLPATVFLEYARTGDRSHFEALSFARRSRLANLVLAELFERKGRFVDQIVNGVWAVCEESFWGVPAHLGLQHAGTGLPDVDEPVIDLFAAETASLLAWTSYLLGPELNRVNPLVTRRIATETERRILEPYLRREDWGWMGYTWRRRTGYMRPVNNWNPWINSNVLTAALLLEEDADRRLALVHKVMDSVDAFIEPYPADGGCDEGPSYWSRAGGSLFDVLDLLHSATSGRVDVFDTPLVRDIGRYIYRTYIADSYFIDFADASAKTTPEAPLVFRFGRAIGDDTMMAFASYVARREDYGRGVLPGSFGVLGRVLPALFTLEALRAQTPAEPLVRDVWLPDIQIMAARAGQESRDGFYLAAKAGHNDESHNHNDVGTFIVYYDGRPVLVDAGAQTYTAQTFSSRRYELWNNQSAYHNLPTINGFMQHEGRTYGARDVDYRSDDRGARLSLDLAPAYPEGARVERWHREIALQRGGDVRIDEDYGLGTFVEPFTLNFLTPLTPSASTPGRVLLPDSAVTPGRVYLLEYDAARFEPMVETIPITDTRMHASWGDVLHRIVLTSKTRTLSDRFTIRIAVQ